tara:strand:- start:1155 stop:1655 length:501 start_codon:yes stop_codon:yes gene_type:complete
MPNLLKELDKVRNDDHIYYHNNLINRKLHFLSGLTFILSYVLIFEHFEFSVYLAWLVAMPLRQIGHFVFEPSNEETEQIKAGYNLERKVILHTVVYVPPVIMYLNGLYSSGFLAVIWFMIAVIALLSRGIYLMNTVNIEHGISWMLKIITDPFHDVYLYHSAFKEK